MAQNSIRVKNYLNIFEEMVAVAAITPGMLVEIDSAGEVQAHSAASGITLPMFALEDELQGNGITDAYSADDQVQVWIPQRGDQVYAVLADGESVAIGDFVVSNGSGALVKLDTVDSAAVAELPNAIVGQCLEAVDLSDSANLSATGRVIIRII